MQRLGLGELSTANPWKMIPLPEYVSTTESRTKEEVLRKFRELTRVIGQNE